MMRQPNTSLLKNNRNKHQNNDHVLEDVCSKIRLWANSNPWTHSKIPDKQRFMGTGILKEPSLLFQVTVTNLFSKPSPNPTLRWKHDGTTSVSLFLGKIQVLVEWGNMGKPLRCRITSLETQCLGPACTEPSGAVDSKTSQQRKNSGWRRMI